MKTNTEATREFNLNGTIWKDSTSYSQGDKERKPCGYSCQFDGFRITVTNGHIHHRPDFIFHCFEFGFDGYTLKHLAPKDHREAAKFAMQIVKNKLTQKAALIPNF